MMKRFTTSLARSVTKNTASLSAVDGKRSFHSSPTLNHKVAVVGAAGGIGQALSLLIKMNPHVTELNLFDVAPVTPGVAADLSHIPTECKVKGFSGEELKDALDSAEIVVIPAGVPRKPGMTRDDLFAINAGIVADTMKQAAESCPDATFLIISNPVNSTVPIASEVLKHYNVYNPKKLFGVTSLDLCRAETFVAENLGQNIDDTVVPVVGGHAGTTIVPLLSQSGGKFTDADRDALTQRIMFGGDEVVQAKAGGGSATLSMAYAGARMTESVLLALDGEYIEEFAFVESDLGIAPFFSSRVTLDKTGGVSEISPVKDITDYEQQLIDDMKDDLNAQVAKGIQFGKDYAAKQ